MLYGPIDPNERFRDRRQEARRRRRRRRAAAFGLALALLLAASAGWRLSEGTTQQAAQAGAPAKAQPVAKTVSSAATGLHPRPLPVEIRGVHVTAPLASLQGKLEEYVRLERFGLNTIELDVKDEGGVVGFVPSSVPLASRSGAAKPYYRPKVAARLAHEHGVYLIGRVVVFQDPFLAQARPELAIRRLDGSIWRTSGGLAWVNPYDKRVWSYAVSVAAAAARAGFDEIMFDYVRFPS